MNLPTTEMEVICKLQVYIPVQSIRGYHSHLSSDGKRVHLQGGHVYVYNNARRSWYKYIQRIDSSWGKDINKSIQNSVYNLHQGFEFAGSHIR